MRLTVDNLPVAVIYSRRGCHLCEQMLEEIEPLIKGRAHLEIRDVDDNPDWVSRYGARVPVLLVANAEVCHFHLEKAALEQALTI